MSLDERFDPVDLLDLYEAPAGWDTPSTDPADDALFARIVQRATESGLVRFGARRRHLRLVTGVVVSVALGGAAAVAATTFWASSPQNATTLSCWSEPVSPPDRQVAFGWDGSTDPVELCASEWRDGDLGTSGPPEPLRPCVTGDGVTAVVPGAEDVCTALGLASFAPLDPTDPDDQRTISIAGLERRLVETFNVGPCRLPDEVRDEVRALLDDAGFADWSISVSDRFDGAEPCASVSLDPTTETVDIVPA